MSVKLGFVFLFAVVFTCNCYENPQVEDPAEKQEGLIAEGGAVSPSNEYDDGLPKITTPLTMVTSHRETSPKKKPLNREMTTEGSEMSLSKKVSATKVT